MQAPFQLKHLSADSTSFRKAGLPITFTDYALEETSAPSSKDFSASCEVPLDNQASMQIALTPQLCIFAIGGSDKERWAKSRI